MHDEQISGILTARPKITLSNVKKEPHPDEYLSQKILLYYTSNASLF